MKAESYYCPLCGNRPYAAFVPCRLLEQPICTDCDHVITQYFQNDLDDQASPPKQIDNLVDCSHLPLDECKDLWRKQRFVALLRDLRDEINLLDEEGGLWDTECLVHLNHKIQEVTQIVSDINCSREHKYFRKPTWRPYESSI